MEDPGVLIPLNNYLDKRTEIMLNAVSKTTNKIIKLRTYNIDKLNLSYLNLIKMFVRSKYNITFKEIKHLIKPFKYGIAHLSQIHYNLFFTFLIYKYIYYEYTTYNEDFMDNYKWCINKNLINEIKEYISSINIDNLDLKVIYSIVNRYNFNWTYQELIMI